MEASENHVFISYAHRDNHATLGPKGWVTNFYEVFRDFLGIRMGAEPVIWRDAERLQGNSALTPEILKGLERSYAFRGRDVAHGTACLTAHR